MTIYRGEGIGNSGVGSTWYLNTGAPADGLGIDGDLYLNTTTCDYYQKTGGAWNLVGTIRGTTGATGPTGPQGPAGANGTNGTNGTNGADGVVGSIWYTGEGAPSSGLGIDGDYYLNVLNGNYYKKISGSWGTALASLVGPTGATGPTGPQGPAGGLRSKEASIPGTLTTFTGSTRWYPRDNITLTNVFVSMGTTPAAGSAVFNVRKNGTAIFTSSKPTVTAGNYTSGANAISVAMTPTDYLTIDVETAAGADANLRIDYSI